MWYYATKINQFNKFFLLNNIFYLVLLSVEAVLDLSKYDRNYTNQ
jgi:hypothetical protein